MSADELVDGLLVRYFLVPCSCGECEEPRSVVLVAVPGEDRWVAVSASVPEAWPVTRDSHEGADADWFDVASRLVAVLGLPWDQVDSRAVAAQVSSVLAVLGAPVALAALLELSPEEARRAADVGDVRARAHVQAATS